MGMFIGGMALR